MASITVDMIGIVKVNTYLHVRNRPSMSGDIINQLTDGTELIITQMDGDWCYVSNYGGWSHSDYIELFNNNPSNTVSVSKEEQERLAQEAEDRKIQAELERQLNVIGENLSTSTLIDDNSIVDSLIVNNLNGIYGIPYQFMASVDPRLRNTDMGRKYSEKIISKMPLLCMTPGRVKFMSNFSKEEKEGIFAALETGIETDISNIVNRNGRYFTFEFAYDDYFNYVNGLCWVGARFLGIQDVKLNIGSKEAEASKFDWRNALNSELKATLTGQEFIGFYMDSTDSVSETFTNNTTQSQLAETLKGWSDKAREMGFLLGAGAGIQQAMVDEADLNATIDHIKSISSKYLNGSSLFTDIASNFATVAVGGKLLFPEIWADSEYSRDFDITIKLRTPDSDIVSWYINIYVPLCHLIALAAGHQTENVNGYYSPFLIRAFYKGLFNVDMGIITSMNIRKGKEASWNIDGLPTEIDVEITIKDLYNMLSIVPSTEAKNFVTNNILMDYIANTCGININQIDVLRSLEIYYILQRNEVVQLPNRIIRQFQNAIDNYGMELYNGLIDKFLI